MKINMVCVEDALIALGFRKIVAQIRSFHEDTHTHYAPLARRSLWKLICEKQAETEYEENAKVIAQEVASGDIVAFSSMSDYSAFVKAIIKEVRQINPKAYIVWGGVHPIIVPEDAIEHADAVCTGEGEFAFQEFFEKFKNERDFTDTKNFWFKHQGKIIRNGFLPLMTNEQMSNLPILEYCTGEEKIFERKKGFVPLTLGHYLKFEGLGYNTIWSIGCPFVCTYCGNTKFIANDKAYRKMRYPMVDFMMRELEQALSKNPYINSILFHDDSFMALPHEVLREFADEYKKRIKIPFAVFGVIPNFVRAQKFDILVQGGMNRIRMGVQSGSERILEFYKRPSPPKRIMEAAQVINQFTPYMIPPAFDIISDNPIETKQDVEDTMRLLYEMPRPFVLNLYSLRVMPNTDMAKQFEKLNIHPHDMAQLGYHELAPTFANCFLYLICVLKPPRFIFEWWLKKAQPFHVKQRKTPIFYEAMHFLWLVKRGSDHLRHLDFALLPGKIGRVLHQLGILRFWRRFMIKKYIPSSPQLPKLNSKTA